MSERTSENEIAADWRAVSRSPEETETLARAFATRCRGGEIIFLKGPLGAGKTLFASAFGAAMGIDEPLVSPTFVLHRVYSARDGLTVHHLDFYRLGGTEDLDSLGFDELAGERSIVLVEWAERCPGAFGNFTVEIELQVTGEETRTIMGRWGGLPFDREQFLGCLPELVPKVDDRFTV